MNNSKLIRTLVVGIALVILAGCAGNGIEVISPFAGTRDIAFYDEDHSNSSQAGNFEVVVDKNGNFDSYGLAYTYSPDYGEKGKVISGWIKPDRTFRVVVKIDTLTWPESRPLNEPYYMVASGRVDPSGGHYLGTAQIKYYQTDDFAPGQEIKDIPYDITVYHLPDRGVHKPKKEADFVNFLKKLK